MPSDSDDESAVVGINVHRIITRQRFTAAHELCHHLKDYDKQFECLTNSKNANEKYAEKFAAALLMPMDELKKQIDKKKKNGFVGLDSILEISDYFGVSFKSCLQRIAYNTDFYCGECDSKSIESTYRKYKPDTKRRERNLSYTKLYMQLLDCYEDQLSFISSNYAKYVFQNNYIYNDARLEGVDISIEEASEIVTDLRLKEKNSEYCVEDKEAFLSIAGNYEMYSEIFGSTKKHVGITELINLNKKLYSHYPYSEYGGEIRNSNTLVIGARFETVDYSDIYNYLGEMENDISELEKTKYKMKTSDYIKQIVMIHHRITLIHPFNDGNGRTARAFMNMQLVNAGLPPIYIFVKEKKEYLKALKTADVDNNYDLLFELVVKKIIIASVELSMEL